MDVVHRITRRDGESKAGHRRRNDILECEGLNKVVISWVLTLTIFVSLHAARDDAWLHFQRTCNDQVGLQISGRIMYVDHL